MTRVALANRDSQRQPSCGNLDGRKLVQIVRQQQEDVVVLRLVGRVHTTTDQRVFDDSFETALKAVAASPPPGLVIDIGELDARVELVYHPLVNASLRAETRVKVINVPRAIAKPLASYLPRSLLAKDLAAAVASFGAPKRKRKSAPARKPNKVASATRLTIERVFASPARDEDARLLRSLRERGHDVVVPPRLALGKRVFADETTLVWELFNGRGQTVVVATVVRKKPTLKRYVPHADDGDDTYNYNAWDDLLPLVRGRPVLLAGDEVYVGFNDCVAQLL